jgi:hypothetical protein
LADGEVPAVPEDDVSALVHADDAHQIVVNFCIEELAYRFLVYFLFLNGS